MMNTSAPKTIFHLTSDEMPALERQGSVRRFATGDTIFSAGDPGDGFYVVIEGRVRITAMVGRNEPRVLATIHPGDFFGEMAVVDESPRSGTATVEIPTKALFLDRNQMLALLEARPRLALMLLRAFCDRMRALNSRYLDEMLQAERMALVGRFAAGIVHDFKSPLAVIGMSAELAAQEDASPERRLRKSPLRFFSPLRPTARRTAPASGFRSASTLSRITAARSGPPACQGRVQHSLSRCRESPAGDETTNV